ncbi:MAG: hypothetical protein MPJ22_00105, partial [Pirellulales bacterium]|nr:hypothetical protein [Pirellulales bacterium]MDA8040810.1 hypothetical protein [Pirellulales bacterium]
PWRSRRPLTPAGTSPHRHVSRRFRPASYSGGWYWHLGNICRDRRQGTGSTASTRHTYDRSRRGGVSWPAYHPSAVPTPSGPGSCARPGSCHRPRGHPGWNRHDVAPLFVGRLAGLADDHRILLAPVTGMRPFRIIVILAGVAQLGRPPFPEPVDPIPVGAGAGVRRGGKAPATVILKAHPAGLGRRRPRPLDGQAVPGRLFPARLFPAHQITTWARSSARSSVGLDSSSTRS